MKVLHLSYWDNSGGAARAAYRLHGALSHANVESRMLVAVKQSHDPSVYIWPLPTRRAPNVLLQSLRRRIESYRQAKRFDGKTPNTCFSECNAIFRAEQIQDQVDWADVVNLHWVTNLVDWPTTLPRLAQRKPLVWTLHDMNPFSGIWHYRPDVNELSDGLRRWDQKVSSIKQKALGAVGDGGLVAVAPSKWIAEQMGQSATMGRFRVVVIPGGVDVDIFKPINQLLARKIFNIPEGAGVLGFIADRGSDPHKGYHLLREVLGELREKRSLYLLTVGKNYTPVEGIPFNNLGRVENDAVLALFYSALDIFVCPSLQDNLPNTVPESLACGTPVVAFPIGGLPDMVRPGVTGWLCDSVSAASLRETLAYALIDPTLLRLRETCRLIACKEYATSTQADAYRRLYETKLGIFGN